MGVPFDRSVCFTFFSSFLPSIELAEELYGKELAYELVKAIVSYGLYEQEPEDEVLARFMKAIKPTIDSSQAKRARHYE